jgi:hypothetical protein
MTSNTYVRADYGALISAEIYAAQQAYAARPFAVRWYDSHYSATHRFHTFNEAFDYAQDQWQRICRDVARWRFHASHLQACAIITPAGSMPLHYYLLTNNVSSY